MVPPPPKKTITEMSSLMASAPGKSKSVGVPVPDMTAKSVNESKKCYTPEELSSSLQIDSTVRAMYNPLGSDTLFTGLNANFKTHSHQKQVVQIISYVVGIYRSPILRAEYPETILEKKVPSGSGTNNHFSVLSHYLELTNTTLRMTFSYSMKNKQDDLGL